ncbi:MAG: ATP-grasp domain-containing protein [Halobacteriota archaeon]
MDDLISFLEQTDHAVVFPLTDQLSVLLSKHKSDLEATGTRVAVEDWDTFEVAYDKQKLATVADNLDVRSPETFAPQSSTALDRIADTVPYPAVIKPRSKTVWDANGVHHKDLVSEEHFVDSPAELRRSYRSLLDSSAHFRAHPPLVQEYISGDTWDTVVLAEDGDILTYFQQRRVRTYPSSCGTASLLESVYDPTMLEHAAELIDRLEWTGPAMVEFMKSPDGTYSLIEVNGRYWGGIPFTLQSGVDVAWLHYQQLLGQQPETVTSYRTGLRHRRLLFEDILWLGEQLRDGNVGAIYPFTEAFVTANGSIHAIDDPLPTLGALWNATRTGSRHVARTLRSQIRDRL